MGKHMVTRISFIMPMSYLIKGVIVMTTIKEYLYEVAYQGVIEYQERRLKAWKAHDTNKLMRLEYQQHKLFDKVLHLINI